MYPSTKGHQQYQNNQILTASGPELTLMLYKAALKNLKQAQKALQDSDFQTANRLLIKTQDIYYELMVSLDESYEISQSLKALYQFLIEHLMKVNANKNPDGIEKILPIAEDFVVTWQEAMKLAKEENADGKIHSPRHS